MMLQFKRATRIIGLPGETAGYPAQPRLIRPSTCQSVSEISFNYTAENCPSPTDLVNYSLKIVN
jgi:hypothetical protein